MTKATGDTLAANAPEGSPRYCAETLCSPATTPGTVNAAVPVASTAAVDTLTPSMNSAMAPGGTSFFPFAGDTPAVTVTGAPAATAAGADTTVTVAAGGFTRETGKGIGIDVLPANEASPE